MVLFPWLQVMFSCIFACLVIFGWMPDIVNCILLDAIYLCVPIDILSFVLKHKLSENSWILSRFAVLSF